MSVPVVVETDSAPAIVPHHKPTTASARTGTIKGRKVSEKKRKIGQVLAGSAPASVSNGGSENGELDSRNPDNADAASLLNSYPSPPWG